ncbi:hypothetical protein KIN20_038244 [Parelaphostrongylus tenuis]|uniref:Uncharacterized protein n=1 Tax=Parelaphostrongylus tenuis TaxID=148309 RepID=A0AAD5WMT9_PARTN|nr:hypothetical protein KIN20_038244 [Parelaphostrongylus tenuis]
MTSRKHTDTASEDQASHKRANNAPRNTRVAVSGGITFPGGARSLIELGPRFSTPQPISKASLRRVVCNLHDLLNKLREMARYEETYRIEQQLEVVSIPPFPRPFYRQQDPNEEVERKFWKFADETFKTLFHYRAKRLHSNLIEVQKRDMEEVRELIREERTRLSVSDKGEEFVVIP